MGDMEAPMKKQTMKKLTAEKEAEILDCILRQALNDTARDLARDGAILSADAVAQLGGAECAWLYYRLGLELVEQYDGCLLLRPTTWSADVAAGVRD